MSVLLNAMQFSNFFETTLWGQRWNKKGGMKVDTAAVYITEKVVVI